MENTECCWRCPQSPGWHRVCPTVREQGENAPLGMWAETRAGPRGVSVEPQAMGTPGQGVGLAQAENRSPESIMGWMEHPRGVRRYNLAP